MKDWRGKTIKKGVKVVYPGRQGSSIWVVEAEVISVDGNEILAQPVRTTGSQVSGRPVRIKNVDRVTVL